MPSFLSLLSELITPEKGTNSDSCWLCRAEKGDSPGWVRMEQPEGCWFLCHWAVPAPHKGGVFCLSLPLALQFSPFLSINVSFCVPFGQDVWHYRCWPVQDWLCVLPPSIAHHSTFPHSSVSILHYWEHVFDVSFFSKCIVETMIPGTQKPWWVC